MRVIYKSFETDGDKKYPSLGLLCLVLCRASGLLLLLLHRQPEFLKLLGLCRSNLILSNSGFHGRNSLGALSPGLCECLTILRLASSFLLLIRLDPGNGNYACGYYLVVALCESERRPQLWNLGV